MNSNMDKKIVYVTGGSSGLGLAATKALAEDGATVVILDLDAERGRQAIDAASWPGAPPHVVRCDTSSIESVTRAFEEAADAVGEPDALVNNAGIREITSFLDLAPSEWDRVIGINLSGYFYCAQLAGKSMAARAGGAIVNVSSCAGIAAVPGRPAYSAAKAGVIGLTKAMATELGPFNIRTNAICPSIIVTPLTEDYFEDAEFAKGMTQIIPMGRPGQAAEVGDLIVYLLGERASYVNGSIVSIDGGFMAGKSFSDAEAGTDTRFMSERGVA